MSFVKTMKRNCGLDVLINCVVWCLIIHTCHCQTLDCIDLNDIGEIYNQVGLVNNHANNIQTNDDCAARVSVNNSVGVFCPTVHKCQINSLNRTSFYLDANDSVIRVWNRCRYPKGAKLFDERELGELNSNVSKLVFSGTKISKLPETFFCGVSNLTSLDLSRNRFFGVNKSQIGLGESCEISNEKECCGCQLKELILDKNPIEKIEDDAFCGLSTLLVLRISGCGIHTLGLEPLRGLNHLKYLDLSRNNLSSLSNQTFSSNINLQILFLSDNNLNGDALNSLKPLQRLRQLNLNRNRIENLDSKTLERFPDLKMLCLKDNLLSSVPDDAFSHLLSLRDVNLGYNKIHNLSGNQFRGLRDLVSVDVSNNNLQRIEDGAFRDCINVTVLKFSNNLLINISNSLTNLTSLKQLYLDRNRLVSINRSELKKLISLEELDVSYNNVSVVSNGAFDGLRRLKTVTLTGNQLSEVKQIFVNARIVNLFIDKNRLTSFSFSDFSPSIKFLSVSGNTISKFNSSAQGAINVNELDISCNLLERLENLNLPGFLVKLNARENKINFISYDKNFINAMKLEEVDLQENHFQEICQSWVKVNNIKHYFAGNPLKCSCENKWLKTTNEIGFGDLFGLKCTPTFTRTIAKKSTKITSVTEDLFLCKSESNSSACLCDSNRRCGIPCPDKCQCYFSELIKNVYVDCGDAGLNEIPQSVSYGNADLTLYLDGNNFFHLNDSSLESFTKAANVYLNNSNIFSLAPKIFANMSRLKLLDLEHNHLRSLPVGLFDNLQLLQKLYLQYNSLINLRAETFVPLVSLQILDLSSNRLSNFSAWELASLKALEYLNLRNNSWTCECNFLNTFERFIQNGSMSLNTQADQLYCVQSNKTLAAKPITKYFYSSCLGTRHPQTLTSSTITNIWASLLVVFIALTVISILAFYYRQEMQVMLYSHYGVRVFQRSQSRTSEEDGKVYDAFISYSSDDEEFLAYHLLPGLEQIDRPYRLCLHQRDFAPGAFITDSILEAVERSSRTIILLTENFIQSEWCKFEFKTAHVQMLHDRCARVLMVVVGEIPEGVDPDMKLYLKTNTYLKWGEKLFWEKLYFSLPDPKVDEHAKESMEMLTT